MYLKDIPINNIGLIKGRDAMIIKSIQSSHPLKYEVIFSVSSRLCENKPIHTDACFDMVCVFDRVLMFNIYSDEMSGRSLSEECFDMYASSESESAIEEIIDSELVINNENKRGFHELKHIHITAYDYIIEVVCSYFEVKLPF